MAVKRKHVVILGAGFAGLRVALDLATKCDSHNLKITLVDKKSNHIYTPDLYEVASNFHKEITDECLISLRKTVATPITDVLGSKKVKFIQSEVLNIDTKEKRIELKKGKLLKYDTLAVCLGSATNYYGIKGLKQFSYPVKSMEDAIAINCHLDTLFKELWKKDDFKEVVITVGGGGVTGVEFASELPGYLDQLSEKFDYPRSKIKLQIIQGGFELIGKGKRISDLAKARLKKAGVKIILGQYITEVGPNWIQLTGKKTKKKKKIHSDLLLWTGGVKVNPLIETCLGDKDCRGAIPVNQFLQSLDHAHVYAGGDNIFFEDADGNRAPMLAQAAVAQGKLIAKNIILECESKELKAYVPRNYTMIIPIAGKYGIIRFGKWVNHGIQGWFLRRLVDLKYACSILPVGKALKKWQHGNKIFVEND